MNTAVAVADTIETVVVDAVTDITQLAVFRDAATLVTTACDPV
jgi:hypothetical protein